MTLSDELRARYLERHPAEAARLVEAAPELMEAIADSPTSSLATFFDRVDPASMPELFLALPEPRQGPLLESLSIRASLTLLRALETDQREALLNRLPKSLGRELRDLLEFPYGTAGGYMDRPIAQFRTDMTVAEPKHWNGCAAPATAASARCMSWIRITGWRAASTCRTWRSRPAKRACLFC
jgi:Mg/Co/Ni transporter MgtE